MTAAAPATPTTFDVRCRVCRRKLGVATVSGEHDCDVVFETTCRTKACRDRTIHIQFGQSVITDARHERGF